MEIKPILFNTEMVAAILEGQKTQTRRTVKQPPIVGDIMRDEKGWYYEDGTRNGHSLIPQFSTGDILWVRETWQHVYNFDDGDQPIEGTGRYVYYADNPMPFDYWVDTYTGEHKEQMPWKPSIHMPKEAARIFLRVKDVRVDRLRNMGYSDLADEGFSGWERFISLWNSTIKPEDRERYGWNADPWVWVIEFERCKKPEGWCT